MSRVPPYASARSLASLREVAPRIDQGAVEIEGEQHGVPYCPLYVAKDVGVSQTLTRTTGRRWLPA